MSKHERATSIAEELAEILCATQHAQPPREIIIAALSRAQPPHEIIAGSGGEAIAVELERERWP